MGGAHPRRRRGRRGGYRPRLSVVFPGPGGRLDETRPAPRATCGARGPVTVADVRAAIDAIADTGTVLELRRDYGVGVVTALIRVEGWPTVWWPIPVCT